MSQPLPTTVAHIRVIQLSWAEGLLKGEVETESYQWQFQWDFRRGHLAVRPSLGRALIYEALGRFLERQDYQLEPGSDYELVLRTRL